MNNQSTKLELMEFVEPIPESGCWIWSSDTLDDNGCIHIDGKAIRTDILSWEVKHGPIPIGQSLFHKCKVWCCVNPDHLLLKDLDTSEV